MGGVPFGTKLMINGQVYTVEDRGTAYGHVDIFCSSHSEALSFGVQYADVYQLSGETKIRDMPEQNFRHISFFDFLRNCHSKRTPKRPQTRVKCTF